MLNSEGKKWFKKVAVAESYKVLRIATLRLDSSIHVNNTF
jgi:hypothetical protein